MVKVRPLKHLINIRWRPWLQSVKRRLWCTWESHALHTYPPPQPPHPHFSILPHKAYANSCNGTYYRWHWKITMCGIAQYFLRILDYVYLSRSWPIYLHLLLLLLAYRSPLQCTHTYTNTQYMYNTGSYIHSPTVYFLTIQLQCDIVKWWPQGTSTTPAHDNSSVTLNSCHC